ncbi:hypothetical protein VPH35_066667 [Triticum aestivum]
MSKILAILLSEVQNYLCFNFLWATRYRSTLSPCLSSTLSLGHCLQFPPPDQAIMDSDDEVDNASRPPAAPCVQGIFKKLFIPQITYFTMELLIYAISINGEDVTHHNIFIELLTFFTMTMNFPVIKPHFHRPTWL